MKNMTKQEKFHFISFIIAIMITCIFMFVFISQKNGWHEDEIFSYGSSNYKYDNLFQRYADKDSLNQLIDEKVMDENPIKTVSNIWYYVTHSEEFMQEYEEKRKEEHPIWKTSQDAKDYVTVSNDEILNYWSVYYNQSRDVHPPLFYMLVHFVSSLCLNHFSKYIIFTINLAFFIGSCLIIRKILKLFHKEHLTAGVVLLYGLSMGGITTVLFQRMYMMLTFFVITYLYLNLKITKNDYKIDDRNKMWLTLTIILGFLTQYYFCIYVVVLALIVMIAMLKKKQYQELKSYIWCHVKAAIIGICLFPASIYHIFFSYRGAAGGVVEANYLDRLLQYINKVFYAFSIGEKIGYMLIGALVVLLVIQFIKAKRKDIILMATIPIEAYILVIAKIAPFINIRYITPVLLIIAIGVAVLIEIITKWIIENTKKYENSNKVGKKYLGSIILLVITIGISIYGFTHSKPEFLYEDYDKRIELAEEYQNLKLVYVEESEFSHLQDMEEFLRYKNSLIINPYQLEVLIDDQVIKNESEYILNIKCWVSNFDETLQKVLEYTNAKEYEMLLDDGESRIYKVYRNQ